MLSVVLLAVLSGSAPAAAKEFSVSECVGLALAKSQQTAAGLYNESRAKASFEELSRAKRPQLSLPGSLTTSDDNSTNVHDANKTSLRLEQSAYPFSQAWVLADQKASEYKAAKLSRVESEQDVTLRVRQFYLAVLRDKDIISNLDLVEEELKKLSASVIPRYAIGGAPPFDLVKVKVAISDLSRQRELTQAQLVGEKSRLGLLMGLEAAEEFELKPVDVLPAAAEADLKKAFAANPTLQALDEELRASELGVTASRRSRLPSLVTGAEYGYEGQSADVMAKSWNVFFGFKLNLFDWGMISSQIDQQKASASLAHTRLELEKQSVSSELIEAWATAKARLTDRERLLTLLPETRQSALATVERYRRGAVGILEATDAVSLWLSTLLDERAAFYAVLADFARIDRLSGAGSYAKP